MPRADDNGLLSRMSAAEIGAAQQRLPKSESYPADENQPWITVDLRSPENKKRAASSGPFSLRILIFRKLVAGAGFETYFLPRVARS